MFISANCLDSAFPKTYNCPSPLKKVAFGVDSAAIVGLITLSSLVILASLKCRLPLGMDKALGGLGPFGGSLVGGATICFSLTLLVANVVFDRRQKNHKRGVIKPKREQAKQTNQSKETEKKPEIQLKKTKNRPIKKESHTSSLENKRTKHRKQAESDAPKDKDVQDLPHILSSPISFPPGYDVSKIPEGGLTFQDYCRLIESLKSTTGPQTSENKSDNEIEFKQEDIDKLAAYPDWMLHVLASVPEKAVKLATIASYEKSPTEFITFTKYFMEEFKIKIRENKLTLDERKNSNLFYTNLSKIFDIIDRLEHHNLTRMMHNRLLEKGVDLSVPVDPGLLLGREDNPLRGHPEIKLRVVSELVMIPLMEDLEQQKKFISASIKKLEEYSKFKPMLREKKADIETSIYDLIQTMKGEGVFSRYPLLSQLLAARNNLAFAIAEKSGY